jgi:transcriptional regulator with XRE-family HTH domain
VNEEARRAFVERLRARRIELGLRLEDVAQMLGVANSTIHSWELGKKGPRWTSTAERWAAALGVRVVNGSLDELFTRERAPCGTVRGYQRHRRSGERCPDCWAAWSSYNWTMYVRRNGRTPRPVEVYRAAVVELLAKGLSAAAISRELGIPRSTASMWARKLRPQAVSTVVDTDGP